MNINLSLFAQALTFALFIWFTVKFIWPPLLRAIEQRQKQIAEGLAAAERGKLKDAAVFEQQVRRMLADPRSKALVENFAGQWLQLRMVPTLSPDKGTFPQWDDSLKAQGINPGTSADLTVATLMAAGLTRSSEPDDKR